MKPAVWLVVVKSFVTSWMSLHCALGVNLVGRPLLRSCVLTGGMGQTLFDTGPGLGFFINNEKIDLITAFCVYLCYLFLIFKFV